MSTPSGKPSCLCCSTVSLPPETIWTPCASEDDGDDVSSCSSGKASDDATDESGCGRGPAPSANPPEKGGSGGGWGAGGEEAVVFDSREVTPVVIPEWLEGEVGECPDGRSPDLMSPTSGLRICCMAHLDSGVISMPGACMQKTHFSSPVPLSKWQWWFVRWDWGGKRNRRKSEKRLKKQEFPKSSFLK